MSALSYSEESEVPTRTLLASEPLESTWTSLEPSTGLNDPVVVLASGVLLATSSLRVASSLVATTAEA